MTDTPHTQEKEAIEDAVNRVLPDGKIAVTQKGQWVTHDDGSISPPSYTVTYTATSKPAPPSDPPPISPPPPTDPVEPPPSDTSGFQPPASSGWKGLTGLQVIPPIYPNPLPAKGQCISDPITGADVYRVTNMADVPGAKGSLIVYSRYPPTSCDGRMLLVHDTDSTSSRITDLTDLTVFRQLKDDAGRDIGEVNEIRWDYNNPSIIRYVKGMQFWQQDVSTGKNTLIRDFAADFPDGDLLMNDVEGDSSHDSRYWCWQVKKIPKSGSYYAIAFVTYDRIADKILGTMTAANWGLPQGATTPEGRMPTPNMVEISPCGTRALIDWNRCWGEGSDPNSSFNANLIDTHADGPHVYTLDLNPASAVKVGVAATHSGWAQRKSDMAWMFVSQNNRQDFIEACDMIEGWNENGTGSMLRLLTHGQLGYGAGNPENAVGMHFGKFRRTPGYAVMSTCARISSEPGDNQLMIMPLENNCTPIRVCPLNNDYQGGYRDEGSVAVGADDLSFFWTSNMGQVSDSDDTGFREVSAMRLTSDQWPKAS